MELHKPIKKTCPNLAGIDNTVKFLIKIMFDYTVPADIFFLSFIRTGKIFK